MVTSSWTNSSSRPTPLHGKTPSVFTKSRRQAGECPTLYPPQRFAAGGQFKLSNWILLRGSIAKNGSDTGYGTGVGIGF